VYRAGASKEKERKKETGVKKLEEYVRSIPDFPEPGIIFRDVTTILQDPDGLCLAIDGIRKALDGLEFDVVVGPESRGFIFGVPVAYAMHKGFVPIRKKGKLPCETVSVSYDLEYGSAELEIHADAIRPGQKVVVIDDLIATGGTTEAIIKLIEKLGGEVVKLCFVMELAGLNGRKKLRDYPVESLIIYEGK
jgi:adenine phosphoribosyltransferase